MVCPTEEDDRPRKAMVCPTGQLFVMMEGMISIANGQGFGGDWLEAPVRLVEQGPIDYLALDYLAEITMSILQKQRQADPNLGYARDFPPLVARISRSIRERGVKIV